jgi:hypothetical protein
MIQIAPGGCSAEPNEIDLGGSTTVRFSARSSRDGGESSLIIFDLGDGASVVFRGAPFPGTRLEATRQVGEGNTPISKTVTILPREAGTHPCGDLRINIRIGPAPAGPPDDGCVAHVRIRCTEEEK